MQLLCQTDSLPHCLDCKHLSNGEGYFFLSRLSLPIWLCRLSMLSIYDGYSVYLVRTWQSLQGASSVVRGFEATKRLQVTRQRSERNNGAGHNKPERSPCWVIATLNIDHDEQWWSWTSTMINYGDADLWRCWVTTMRNPTMLSQYRNFANRNFATRNFATLKAATNAIRQRGRSL